MMVLLKILSLSISRMMSWVRLPTEPNTQTSTTQNTIWDRVRIRPQIILKAIRIQRTICRERPQTLLRKLLKSRCWRPASMRSERKATTPVPHSLMLRWINLEWLFRLKDSIDTLVSPFSWKRMAMEWLLINMPLKILSVWTLNSSAICRNQMGGTGLIPMKIKLSLKNNKKSRVS